MNHELKSDLVMKKISTMIKDNENRGLPRIKEYSRKKHLIGVTRKTNWRFSIKRSISKSF